MAKFLSKCPNQVLCMQPDDKAIQNGVVLNIPGKYIQFNNGEYETTEKEQIEFIKGHRLFGTQIIEGSKPKAPNTEE